MKNTRFLLLAIAFLVSVAISGCLSSSTESGTYAIDLSGGDGFQGGQGGHMVSTGGLPQSFTISTTGVVAIDYTPVMPAGLHGPNHLDITVNTIISIDPVVPVTGTPYLVSGTYNIFVFDGVGTPDGTDPVVNSIKIHGGRTLTLGLNDTGVCALGFSNDFINYGTVTTSKYLPESYASLSITANSFINHGTIALNGVLPGQSGGAFTATSINGSFSSGTVNTYGADMVDGSAGAGGLIEMISHNSVVQNLGPLNCFGGAATGTDAVGGPSGPVSLLTSNGTLFNGGKISAYGGDGDTAGGPATGVLFVASYGNAYNVGTIDAHGGDSVEGPGMTGAQLMFHCFGSRLKSIGNINLSGGATMNSLSIGGNGGYMFCHIQEIPIEETEPNLSGSSIPPVIQFAGNIIACGGKSPIEAGANGIGGNGGLFLFSSDLSGPEISFRGCGRFSANGGDAQYAGNGGMMMMYLYEKFENEAVVDLKGGNGLDIDGSGVAYGGNGGNLILVSPYEYGIEEIINSGDINLSGGTNYNRPSETDDNKPLSKVESHGVGAGGICTSYAKNSMINTGNITCTGGNDVGNDPEAGIGGFGGSVELICSNGPLVNQGAINVSGGDGSLAGGYAGGSMHSAKPKLVAPSGVYLEGLGSVHCRGDVIANGGNADAALGGSIGGDGGKIEIACNEGPASVQVGTVAGNAGVGETNGEINDIIIGGLLIQAGTIAP